jgi:hypothetical protein
VKNRTIKTLAVAALLLTGASLAGCNDADVASKNLSKDADNFKIERRIVFVNGITDKYMLTIEGLCSIEDTNSEGQGHQLEVTCKTGPDQYKKHFLGLSDNVTYFAEQLEDANVSTDHYKVTYKPTTIVPDLENTSGN